MPNNDQHPHGVLAYIRRRVIDLQPQAEISYRNTDKLAVLPQSDQVGRTAIFGM